MPLSGAVFVGVSAVARSNYGLCATLHCGCTQTALRRFWGKNEATDAADTQRAEHDLEQHEKPQCLKGLAHGLMENRQ